VTSPGWSAPKAGADAKQASIRSNPAATGTTERENASDIRLKVSGLMV